MTHIFSSIFLVKIAQRIFWFSLQLSTLIVVDGEKMSLNDHEILFFTRPPLLLIIIILLVWCRFTFSLIPWVNWAYIRGKKIYTFFCMWHRKCKIHIIISASLKIERRLMSHCSSTQQSCNFSRNFFFEIKLKIFHLPFIPLFQKNGRNPISKHIWPIFFQFILWYSLS